MMLPDKLGVLPPPYHLFVKGDYRNPEYTLDDYVVSHHDATLLNQYAKERYSGYRITDGVYTTLIEKRISQYG